MALPHILIPGEVARASDVNDNFAYIMSILGPLSTPGRVATTTEFLMGARKNVLLTATMDTGVADSAGVTHRYYQIGWNADFNLVSGAWKFARFVNRGAGALRIGEGELTFLGTTEDTANLNSSMKTLSRLRAASTGYYWYVPNIVGFTNTDAVPTTVQEHNLTLTRFNTPVTIYDGDQLNKAVVMKDARDFGVPSQAVAIDITCEIDSASSTTATRLRFLQARTDSGNGAPSKRYGFTVTAGQQGFGSGAGTVNLGTGAYAHRFTVERTANFDHVYAYVTGYWK